MGKKQKAKFVDLGFEVWAMGDEGNIILQSDIINGEITWKMEDGFTLDEFAIALVNAMGQLENINVSIPDGIIVHPNSPIAIKRREEGKCGSCGTLDYQGKEKEIYCYECEAIQARRNTAKK